MAGSKLPSSKGDTSGTTTAQDNAYPERMNRTIKEECIDYWNPKDYGELKRYLNRAAKQCNAKRPRNNIFRKTPKTFAREVLTLAPHNRLMETIYTEAS